MSDTKGKLENLKDHVVGNIQETVGKVTGNEKLEFKGKITKQTVDFKEKIEEIKEDLLEKINDKIDKSHE